MEMCHPMTAVPSVDLRHTRAPLLRGLHKVISPKQVRKHPAEEETEPRRR